MYFFDIYYRITKYIYYLIIPGKYGNIFLRYVLFLLRRHRLLIIFDIDNVNFYHSTFYHNIYTYNTSINKTW